MSIEHSDICVIGGGLSGLSIAHFLGDLQPDADLVILEAASRPGGIIETFRESGFQAEWGPHGFLDNHAGSRRLLELAGLQEEVTTAPLGRFVRYVCVNGRLVCIPQTPLNILRAPLMPFFHKVGVLRDLFKKPLPGDPSVAQWVQYRFGAAILPFADAVYTGTYAGDIERLKINAVMPGLRAMEAEHGSIIRAGLRRMGKARGKRMKGLPAMTSFPQGMERLPARLAEPLEASGILRYGRKAQEVSRTEDGWRVLTDQGEHRCRRLVLAIPLNQGLRLLTGVDGVTPPPMSEVAEAHLATVILGFTSSADIPFGFGYLAPEKEGRFALGALFSSHMFPGRVPEGQQLLEVLVGGIRHPERLELEDAEIITRALADLRELIHLPDEPCYTRLLRPVAGIPQLEAGYTDLLEWRAQVHDKEPSLHICGFGWKGIGINDMVGEAMAVARRLAEHTSTQGGVEVKGVYF
ncbi:MAG: protoporphyrinogen oxidase [Deltaproteobacteria bacterium]|nr:MAG: protoporphyrinogen oxidase [Deltaproteobacteria bacterium]